MFDRLIHYLLVRIVQKVSCPNRPSHRCPANCNQLVTRHRNRMSCRLIVRCWKLQAENTVWQETLRFDPLSETVAKTVSDYILDASVRSLGKATMRTVELYLYQVRQLSRGTQLCKRSFAAATLPRPLLTGTTVMKETKASRG